MHRFQGDSRTHHRRLAGHHSGNRAGNRSGATIVEAALVLSTFLLVLFAILELGLLVLRYNSLSESARTVAREASVRGEMASPRRTPWGTETYEATADDDSEIAATLRSILVGMPPREVDVRVEWPDAGNEVGDRVRITVEHRYDPLLGFFSDSDGFVLSAVSVMRIAH